jgi:hypothetical protein
MLPVVLVLVVVLVVVVVDLVVAFAAVVVVFVVVEVVEAVKFVSCQTLMVTFCKIKLYNNFQRFLFLISGNSTLGDVCASSFNI